ncbi:helix-turn-helix transcriptional regulator [Psychrobacter sp. 72-O-c]|uniref:helix-turn-helix transcriptional regulator n=1 Tax=Psychrobacter sp. 72-O-c TaxID=2774125 RepID=UPI00191940CF|nr:AlpA family phage regulatory protein [Psychrobacter sp. 72-O-c]
MTLVDQYLRMANLANQPARTAKTYTTAAGQQRTVTAKAATRGITGFSAKHIYHLINQNQFPAPVKIGRASIWRLSEINEWLDSHTTQADVQSNDMASV